MSLLFIVPVIPMKSSFRHPLFCQLTSQFFRPVGLRTLNSDNGKESGIWPMSAVIVATISAPRPTDAPNAVRSRQKRKCFQADFDDELCTKSRQSCKRLVLFNIAACVVPLPGIPRGGLGLIPFQLRLPFGTIPVLREGCLNIFEIC